MSDHRAVTIMVTDPVVATAQSLTVLSQRGELTNKGNCLGSLW